MANGTPECGEILQGLPISPGLALGRAVSIDKDSLSIPRYHLDSGALLTEKQRLEEAITASITQIDEILCAVRQYGSQPEQQALLHAHKMILQDDLFIGRIKRNIAIEQINAEWAVSKAIGEVGTLFEHLESDYFRERRSDLDFIGKRLLRTLLGQGTGLPNSFAEGSIIVARDLSAIDVIQLSHSKVLAIVTALGGPTSHTAIITRSLGIPAVFGVSQLDCQALDGHTIGLDGSTGELFLAPDMAQRARLSEKVAHFRALQAQLQEIAALPAQTADGRIIHLLGNIEFPEEVSAVNSNGGEGIGLYRTEFLFVNREDAPTEEEHYAAYRQVIELAAGRPVTIRTIDLGFDKTFLAHAKDTIQAESNPALGLRAIRLCRQYPELLSNQLGGILRAAVHGPVKLLIPMVSGLEELNWVRSMLQSVAADLQRRGVPYRDQLPLGIMIEVPAAVAIADILATEVDFFSLGTNDLVQYGLAMDRSNEFLSNLYSPMHPAILRMIDMAVSAAHRAGIPVSLCGELGADPSFAPIIAALGIDSVSMTGASIPQVKWAVRHCSYAAGIELWQKMLSLRTIAELREFGKNNLQTLGLK